MKLHPDYVSIAVEHLKAGQKIEIPNHQIKNLVLAYDGRNPLVVRKKPDTDQLMIRTLNVATRG